MITILRGNRLNMDFKMPIEMSSQDKDKFIEFLRELFNTVEEEENFRSKRIGDKSFSRVWTKEEYVLLLTLNKSNEEVSKLLGRSWMSVEMKRMTYIPEMMEYASRKGINILKSDSKILAELVENYIKEHEEELLKRKEKKVEEKRIDKEDKEDFARLPEEISKEENLIGLLGLGITKDSVEAKKKRYEELKKKFAGLEEIK
jgi:hypothetical protein